MFNAVYLLAKIFILRCSYENKFPNLTTFKQTITQFLLVEKSIAMCNSKITEFNIYLNDNIYIVIILLNIYLHCMCSCTVVNM
ncbi:hypothetical protein LSH36_873g00021 [Paralvinella palmiformis]|uniref:Uncharacterized protein n=1 Tax=Paralvinella palmiformis TaxID=53620 RepID=A0AAD9IYD2_9ANNE|nr:hypothetical protein LSH36_873g00021 [Paralvinella palmiformis]